MNKLKQLRIEKNIKQQDLAKALNVTKQSVSNWENNKRLPDINTLIQLADFYNCSLDYLVGRDLKEDNLKTINTLVSDLGPSSYDEVISILNILKKTKEK